MFARPFVLDGSEHFVTTSIGIALAEGGELPDDLIRDADAAMYRAKERGRARYELFDDGLRGRAIVAPADRERPPAGARARRAAARLPAARVAARPLDRRRRGADSLGAPRSRADLAGRLHPGRRGERADRADRPLGARARLPPGRPVVLTSRPDAPPICDVGQPVGRPGRQAHGLPEDGRRRAASDRARSRPACRLEITESVLLETPTGSGRRSCGR